MSPIWIRSAVIAAFALITLSTLAAFGYYSFILLHDIFSKSAILTFNKGAMYLLGVGLSSGLLTLFMICETVGKGISPSLNKAATRIGLTFLGLIFIFPQIAGFGVNSYAGSKGYRYCPEKSSITLFAFRDRKRQEGLFNRLLVTRDDRQRIFLPKIKSGPFKTLRVSSQGYKKMTSKNFEAFPPIRRAGIKRWTKSNIFFLRRKNFDTGNVEVDA